VFHYLKENKYKGVLLLDDICWSDEMIELWNKINVRKYDLTDIGHGGGIAPSGNVTGTGLLIFRVKLELRNKLQAYGFIWESPDEALIYLIPSAIPAMYR